MTKKFSLTCTDPNAPITNVQDIPCNHKYSECGPVNAICGCSEVDEMMNCVTGSYCQCDASNRMFAVDHNDSLSIGGYDLTMYCELLTLCEERGSETESETWEHVPRKDADFDYFNDSFSCPVQRI